MKKYRIGLLHHGSEDEIWGSVVTTYYLQKALKRLGHDVYRISVTQHHDYPKLLQKKTDFIICEGVPEWQIPKGIWDTTDKKIFWWMSDLFYNVDTIGKSNFDGFAVNSNEYLKLLEQGKVAIRIDLAVDKDFNKGKAKKEFKSDFAYVGNYPHKSKSQMDFMFLNSAKYGHLNLWGHGWDKSDYAEYYQEPVYYQELPNLYSSVKYAILLTEKRQMKREMFNNRVYEVLGSGGLALCEKYDALKNSDLGKYITFVKDEKDFENALKNFDSKENKKLRKEAQKYVLTHHNYDIRAKQFIELFEKLKGE